MTYSEVANMIKQAGPRPNERPAVPSAVQPKPQGQPVSGAPVTGVSPQSQPVNNAAANAPAKVPGNNLPGWANIAIPALIGVKGLYDKFQQPNYYAERPKRAVTPLAMDSNIMNRTLY